MEKGRSMRMCVCECVCVRACVNVCAPRCAPACLHMFSCVYNVCFCTFRSYANNIKGSCTAGITKTLRGKEGGGGEALQRD